MKDCIVRLTVIKNLAKDIHYNAHGREFYGIHLLMDRVADGLDQFIDDIKENIYLGRGQFPPASKEIFKVAEAMLPEKLPYDTVAQMGILADFISGTLENIFELVQNTTILMNGDVALFDDISKDLRKKLGLINNTINNTTDEIA